MHRPWCAILKVGRLLYNERDLSSEEHYVDTHGYTENNFAAFAMLGRLFSPRIRGLHKQRIYRIDTCKDYQALTPLDGRSDRNYSHELDSRSVGSNRPFLRLSRMRSCHGVYCYESAKRVHGEEPFLSGKPGINQHIPTLEKFNLFDCTSKPHFRNLKSNQLFFGQSSKRPLCG